MIVYILEKLDEFQMVVELRDVRGVFTTREAAELEGLNLDRSCVTEWEVKGGSDD